MALTAGVLERTGVEVDRIRVVEDMAPVLTLLFTPLFAVVLAGAAVTYAVTGLGEAFDRQLLSVFDALLLVVLALVLYGMSAREPSAPPGLRAPGPYRRAAALRGGGCAGFVTGMSVRSPRYSVVLYENVRRTGAGRGTGGGPAGDRAPPRGAVGAERAPVRCDGALAGARMGASPAGRKQ